MSVGTASDRAILGDPWVDAYRTYLAYFVAVIGSTWMFVAGAHVLVNKTDEGISIWAIMMHLLASISWMTYGMLRHRRATMWAGFTSVMGSMFLLMAIFIVSV